MPVDPTWQNTLTYDGAELRRADAMLVMADGTALGGRSGIRPGDPGLTVTLSGTTINVSAGVAAVYQSGQGVYRAALSTAVSPGTLTAAHATLPRIDLVYLRVWDTDVDASGLRQADVVYLAGTAASSPVAPVPGGTIVYIPLATISVPASGGGSPSVSSTIRAVTVAPGGILPSATAPSNPYIGQYYDSGTSLMRWTGSAWRPVSPFTPQLTSQVSQPSFSTTGSFVAFTSGQWPALSFVVPPSGTAWVSISAAVQNTVTATSTGWVAWAASGGYAESPSEMNGVSCLGSRTYATRRVLRTGMTPGATVTLTPQWQISSAGTAFSQTRISDGQLTVEPVAG